MLFFVLLGPVDIVASAMATLSLVVWFGWSRCALISYSIVGNWGGTNWSFSLGAWLVLVSAAIYVVWLSNSFGFAFWISPLFSFDDLLDVSVYNPCSSKSFLFFPPHRL